MNQIDVFDDYMAMAGHTYDNSLTGVNTLGSSLPYIAMQSITMAGKIYWGKVFSEKLNQ